MTKSMSRKGRRLESEILQTFPELICNFLKVGFYFHTRYTKSQIYSISNKNTIRNYENDEIQGPPYIFAAIIPEKALFVSSIMFSEHCRARVKMYHLRTNIFLKSEGKMKQKTLNVCSETKYNYWQSKDIH